MSSLITSRQNARVKEACALRGRREREARGQTLVYGVRETARALAAGAELLTVFYCPVLFRATEANELIEQLENSSAELLEVTESVFEKLAYGDRLDGVAAVAATRNLSLAELQLPACPLVAIVEGVEKPGNLGAILRSADGAGVDAVVVADPVIDLFNPNTIRASVAMVFHKNVAVATADETLAWLREQGLTLWAARPESALPYHAADFTQSTAILLGNEAEGLTNTWQGENIRPIALPMHGVADSLNVSATAAVLFYEARRQRGASGGLESDP